MSMQDSGNSTHPPVVPGPLAQPESSERPTWVTTAGVLMIVLAVCGLLSAAATAIMPKMMRMQQESMSSMGASMQKMAEMQTQQMTQQQAAQRAQQNAQRQGQFSPAVVPTAPTAPAGPTATQMMQPMQDQFKMMNKMLDQPSWFEAWCYVSAGLVVLVNIGVVAGAVMLLMLRPTGIGISIAAISVAILLGLARIGAGIAMGSMMAFNVICMSSLGLMFSIAILIVLLVGDKKSYRRACAA